MKLLVLNADDFGMGKATNKGIVFCYNNGLLSSASLMPNMPYFSEAVKMLKKEKNLDAGIHLNLTWGKPLTKAKSLTDSKGCFRKDMILRMLRGKFDKSEMEEELRAQVMEVKKHIRPSHINSHKHFHVFPSLMKMIADIAYDNKIQWIRLPNEQLTLRMNVQTLKLLLLKYYCVRASKYYKQLGLKCPNAFFGVADTGRLTLESFKKLLSLVKDGVTEIMCHPGYSDPTAVFDKLNKSRMQELKVLTNPNVRDIVKELDITITGFGEIK